MTVPHMVNLRTAEAGFTQRARAAMNMKLTAKTDATGTAEMPLTGYHAGRIFDERFAIAIHWIQSCYRGGGNIRR